VLDGLKLILRYAECCVLSLQHSPVPQCEFAVSADHRGWPRHARSNLSDLNPRTGQRASIDIAT